MSERVQKNADVMQVFHAVCDLGCRLSGTESEAEALDYVAGFLKSLPGGKVQQHSVTYGGWSSGTCCIEVGGEVHPAFALPRSGTLPEGGAYLKVVDAGRGTLEQLSAIGPNMAGKAVVVTHEFMFAADHIHRMKKYQRVMELGAAAFVIANPDPATGRVTGGVDGTVPGFGISSATRRALDQARSVGEPARFHLDSKKEPKTTRTIDWVRPGTDPELAGQEIIVCAHIDGHESSENAMDNASGVAVALTLAADLCRKPISRSVRVLIFSAEEFGLCGSEAYVEGLSSEQRGRIRAVLNLDCVGGSACFGAMTSGFAELRKIVEQASEATGIDVVVHDPPLKNSDHYNFFIHGIPAMRLIAGFEETNSRLQHVLTEADMRNMVSDRELDAALKLTKALVDAAV